MKRIAESTVREVVPESKRRDRLLPAVYLADALPT